MFDKEAYLQRAKPEKLREIFDKYAHVDETGQKHIPSTTFMIDFLRFLPQQNYNHETARMLGSIVDVRRSGKISYNDFEDYEKVLAYPDAIYESIFRLCNVTHNGRLTYGEFRNYYNNTELAMKFPFEWESPFIYQYFGKDKGKTLKYCEFAGFLHDFVDHLSDDAFKHADKEGSGYIHVESFRNIMINIRKFQLSTEVQRILTEGRDVFQSDKAGNSPQKISFAYFKAFNELLKNLEMAKRVYLHAAHNKTNKEITESQFLHAVQSLGVTMSPLEIQTLFQLCDLIHHKKKITYNDFNAICPEHYYAALAHRTNPGDLVVEKHGIVWGILHVLYRFGVGFIAGGTGATAVFPIDLVKTRIQNQRMDPRTAGARYKGYIDCFLKVLFGEGFFGLYRGLLPQIIGVSPEKAMKLTINDAVRDYFTTADGKIKYRYELLGGACAGCSQVIITNPLEIVKIRLQTAGEVAGGHKVKAREIIRQLGIRGLYKGVRICMVRDIVFGSIYFSTYANLKKFFSDENSYNHPLTLLLAGFCAGVPAASLATPADVVKTRIQVIPREGQTRYEKGIIETFKTILRQEGPKAFTKGMLARVCRSSPQMAITLFVYEIIQRLFYVDFGGMALAGSAQSVSQLHEHAHDAGTNPDNIGGYAAAYDVFTAMENRFGVRLPRVSQRNPSQPQHPETGDPNQPPPVEDSED